jgi:Cdc6-like AAA superfamily ATPase
MTPAINIEEIVWAGFPGLRRRLEKRIQQSMHFSNSTLVLNWGDYGSGKTHAANYFNLKNVLKSLADNKNKKSPFSFKITLPTGKNPIYDLFVSIIDHLDIEDIRKKFNDISGEIQPFIAQFSPNMIIRSILKAFFNDKVDRSLLKKYLYNTISNKEFETLGKYDILRRLSTDDDRIKVLSGIFSCLTFKQKEYSTIITWIDEFENISLLNNVNIENINNFVREFLDNTPNYLLVFLNFTKTAFANLEDLGQYLSDAVKSRVKESVEFKIPDQEELRLYLRELLNHPLYRDKIVENVYHPFLSDAIDHVIDKLGNVSLRRYNEAFSTLLELAEYEEVREITKEFVMQHEDDITGWE